MSSLSKFVATTNKLMKSLNNSELDVSIAVKSLVKNLIDKDICNWVRLKHLSTSDIIYCIQITTKAYHSTDLTCYQILAQHNYGGVIKQSLDKSKELIVEAGMPSNLPLSKRKPWNTVWTEGSLCRETAIHNINKIISSDRFPYIRFTFMSSCSI